MVLHRQDADWCVSMTTMKKREKGRKEEGSIKRGENDINQRNMP